MQITHWAIKNRTTVLVMIFLILIAGIFSYITIPRESFPDVTLPMVLVTTAYEGVSPADIETSLTMKLEDKLSGIKGLKEMTSTSAEGTSLIVLEFYPDIVIEDALQYVRDRVDQAKPDLPDSEDRKEPVISEINVAEWPILQVNVSGVLSPVRLKAIADRLEEEFEKIPGVLEADVLGALEREIRIEIDPDRLVAYHLTLSEILEVIPSENVNISAGGLETPGMKFTIRVPAEFQDPGEVDRLPLTVRNGRTIYLADVADIHDTFKDRDTFARLDGEPTITVALKKRIGENILEITDRAKRVVEEFRRRAPAGVNFEITFDMSDETRMMLSDLENNIFSGLVLVVVVLMIFMGLRTSAIVALAIPMSMLLSFVIIQMLGYTLNMMVLFGLIMALGMLVDNAIVIVENIYRHMQMGMGRVDAARKGTAEVGWPVITSTATTLAAFAPLIFWPDVMGEFMSFLPITLIIVLSCSLFVALVINPTICSIFAPGAQRKLDPNKHHPFVAAYRWLLGKALAHRAITLMAATAVLIGMFVLYGQANYGVELFPKMDPDNGIVNIRAPQGTSIHETDRLARYVESLIAPHTKEHELKYVVANIGAAGGQAIAFGGTTSGPHVGNVMLIFEDFEKRKGKSAKALDEMRQYLGDISGAEIKVEKPQEGPPTGAAVTVRFSGKEFKQLQKVSESAKTMIADVPGLVNLRSDFETARPELRFRIDRRRAALLGVSPRVVGTFLKTYIFGAVVGKYRQFNDEYDITLRLPESHRVDIEDTLRLYISNKTGQPVPISSLGTFEYTGGLGNITRIDQKRVITLSGDAADGFLSTEVLEDVKSRLADGRMMLRSSDITALDLLARRLVDAPPHSTAARLLTRMPPQAAAVIRQQASGTTQPTTTAPTPQSNEQIVAKAINTVLADKTFYRPEDFKTRTLSPEQRSAANAGAIARLFLDDRLAETLNRKALAETFDGAVNPPQQLVRTDAYEISYAGEEEERDKAQAFLLKAFLIALFVIVMILVTQFNTISVPMIIMVTVLLSLVGVLGGLLICAMPFGIIMTGIGVISLAGIVVNNAIVLLDYTRQLQRRGMELIEAAIQAGATRLRPVMLTAITTILGLVPMAVGISFNVHNFSFATKSESSQWWASMAIAVIFGLMFATLLTLVIVPALYVSLYRISAKLGFGGLKRVTNGEAREVVELEDC